MQVAVTAWSALVPGPPAPSVIPGWAPEHTDPLADAPRLLGRKGMLNKEPATRLALCAVHRALGLPEGTRPATSTNPDPHTAVVASANLGNASTVAAVARAVQAGGVREASPLDAPNVSSNVVASTVALWFRFGGPNFMVCSGHPSGLDAVALGSALLAARRARRVVVVGTEPDDPTAAALFAAGGGRPLRAAAACVVLEPGPGDVLVGPVEEHTADGAESVVAVGNIAHDLTAGLGHTYGALGVLQLAAAAELVRTGGSTARVVCGDPVDGFRATTVYRDEEAL
jgi:3-oxoacyl-[acyl-carrier-protein] synthase II